MSILAAAVVGGFTAWLVDWATNKDLEEDFKRMYVDKYGLEWDDKIYPQGVVQNALGYGESPTLYYNEAESEIISGKKRGKVISMIGSDPRLRKLTKDKDITPEEARLRREISAEQFAVEFDDWAEQEMKTHGYNISFREWAEEEGQSHGDEELLDWAQHEEESHDARYDAESYKPPASAIANAKRGLELRKEFGRGGLSPSEAKSQGIDSGVTRARKIASGKVSRHDVRRMSAFNRHRKNNNPSKKMPDGGPTAGTIAWLLWGGTSGVNWAKNKSASMNAESFASERMHGDDTLDRWVENNYGDEYDWALLDENAVYGDVHEILEDFIVLDDEGSEHKGIAIVYRAPPDSSESLSFDYTPLAKCDICGGHEEVGYVDDNFTLKVCEHCDVDGADYNPKLWDAESFGPVDEDGILAKALARARAKSKEPRRPLKITKLPHRNQKSLKDFEEFNSAIVYKKPKGVVAQVMAKEKALQQLALSEALLELEQYIRLGMITEEEAFRKIVQMSQ